MYGICLPTFILKDQPNVGKHTSPMDPMRYLQLYVIIIGKWWYLFESTHLRYSHFSLVTSLPATIRIEPTSGIIATSHDLGPQKVAEEGTSPYFRDI